jgi:hypothetical protein
VEAISLEPGLVEYARQFLTAGRRSSVSCGLDMMGGIVVHGQVVVRGGRTRVVVEPWPGPGHHGCTRVSIVTANQDIGPTRTVRSDRLQVGSEPTTGLEFVAWDFMLGHHRYERT